MPRPGDFARASLITLCLAAQTPAMTAAHADPIHVVCDDARLTGFCDELATAMRDAQDRHPVVVIAPAERSPEAHLTLRFTAVRFTASVLSGHLVWHDRAGSTGSGPLVHLTVADATIREPMLRDLAHQLLSLTDLPL